jgi:hypothetical protein
VEAIVEDVVEDVVEAVVKDGVSFEQATNKLDISNTKTRQILPTNGNNLLFCIKFLLFEYCPCPVFNDRLRLPLDFYHLLVVILFGIYHSNSWCKIV